ncbi:glycosyltransferase family 4 protein [Prauserella muralis]|uniref:Glycosyl transferase n=1 Tax=Prauserella muralis TaxID=588067 RepID=A0A2V4AGW2_9PSEU|nr:glycosyltransferase family 4 protein [Prauserella muralis]PXY19162.1 glycosyl transferase [Prauserella muralis]TWE29073.1 glycosyltransferase involved in cell wall biosynthesis [Prauserella muralis]
MTPPGPPVVHVVLPGDVDDVTVPSGGNVYDRTVCDGLAAGGWWVREHPVPGSWPRPGAPARGRLGRTLAALPDGASVLIDGLVACAVPDLVAPHARRLRLVVLVHLPLGDETGISQALAAELAAAERAALHAASAVVATSPWAARRLLELHGLPADRVHVAEPGAARASLSRPSEPGTRLLCVASVTPRKGHDVLVEALAAIAGLDWSCACVGGLSRDPAYATRLLQLIVARGLDERIRLTGPRTGARLAASYAEADLLVLPSRAETYGMVITEALAHGIPVLATAVGGVPDALGRAPDGSLPGLLVQPGDAHALAAALRHWLRDAELRQTLRAAARQRRGTLPGWDATVHRLGAVLAASDPSLRTA